MTILTVEQQSWPIRGVFTISRGSKSAAEVVVATLSDGEHTGRGEAVPYTRYGESVEQTQREIEALARDIANGLDRQRLQEAMPAGAARNALDCAFWDLEARRAGKPVWQLAGLDAPKPLTTVYTLSLDTPDAMQEAARANADRPILKLKLSGPDDLARVRAVREGAPRPRIVVDANEGWSAEDYIRLAPELAALGVVMIEQPLSAENDGALAQIERAVPVCADESCHDRASLAALKGRYDMVNIKLDKTGGLTEALALKREAEAAGMRVMVGCMLSTSLAMAPAHLVAQGAEVVDLDGPLLLERDRENGLLFEGSTVHPPEPALWG